MIRDDDPFRVCFTGQSGTGKTQLLKLWLERADFGKIFVWDHVGKLVQRARIPTFTRRDVFPALCASPHRIIAFDPSREFPGRYEEGFEWFTASVFYASQKMADVRKLLVVEELQDMAEHTCCPGLAKIFQTGRNYALHVAFTAQAPTEIFWKLRKQITELVTLQHTDPSILGALERWRFNRREIETLGKGHYIVRDVLRGRESRGVVKW